MPAIGIEAARFASFGQWVVLCATGEAIGIALVATVYAAVDRGQLEPPAAWILIAGACEGLALGFAQSIWLRKVGVRPAVWIALTVAGAITGYGLSILGGAGSGNIAPAAVDPPLWIIAGLGSLLGLVMGILMGAVQASALRGITKARSWIAANVLGWMPAMATIMLAATAAQESWGLIQVALLGASAGAIAGALVGGATLLPLSKEFNIR